MKRSGEYKSTGREYTAYVMQGGSWSVEVPSSVVGCGVLRTAEETSKGRGCDVATNAAFFDMSGAGGCEGLVVADATSWGLASRAVGFGVDEDGDVEVGYLAGVANETGWWSFVQGRGWLVRRGEVVDIYSLPDLNAESDFVTEKAPRTAVGILSNGTIALFSVDGEESRDEGETQ